MCSFFSALYRPRRGGSRLTTSTRAARMRRRLSAGKYLQSSKHILEKHKKLRAAVSAPTASFQVSDGIELSVSPNTRRWLEDFGRLLSRAKSGGLTRLLSDWPVRATAVHAVLPRIQLLIINDQTKKNKKTKKKPPGWHFALRPVLPREISSIVEPS